MRGGLGAGALLLAAACAPSPSASTTEAPSGAAPPSAAPAPQTAVEGPVTSATGMGALCDAHLGAARAELAALKQAAGAAEVTWESTLGRVDAFLFEVEEATSRASVLAVAHPDAGVQVAARACEAKGRAALVELWADADVARVVRAFATAGKARAHGDRARFLSRVQGELRRAGADLGAEARGRLRELDESLVRLGDELTLRITASDDAVELAPAALAGLPPDFVAQHPTLPSGKVVIRSTDADVFPLLASASDRAAAGAVHKAFVNRGGRRNVELLEQLVRLRHEKARLLGYDSFAALALEPTWAKTPAIVRDFLEEARLAVAPAAKAELVGMQAEHARLGGKRAGALTPADRYFYEARLREAALGPAAKSLPEHFEFDRTEAAIVELVGELFGLRFERRASEPGAWHPDVHAYDVLAAGDGARVGRLYLDLRPRPSKYQHEAMFALAGYRGRLGDAPQLPEAAVVCSFAPAGAALGGKPAFLTHEQVVTLLHELGHAVHYLLGRTEVASLARLTWLDDFAEAPGQLLEEWAFSAPVLARLARHHRTGAPLPADAIAALQKARKVGRALATQRQLFLASLDLELHSRTPPLDSNALVEELEARFESFAPVRGTHPQGSFEHLARLPAQYYRYQWSLWLARDLLEPFAAEGLPAATTSKRFAEHVLRRGGSMESSKMVEAFLGRPPRRDAYVRFVSGE